VRRSTGVEVWVHAGPTLEDASSVPLFTARGQLRQFATIDAAAGFVWSQGYHGTLELDDATNGVTFPTGSFLDDPSAPWWDGLPPTISTPEGWAAYVGPDGAGQYRMVVVSPKGEQFVEKFPGYPSELDAREVAASIIAVSSLGSS
ncbi:hypothetical protein, partial [uncultured Thiodictyon sp.]|uniref:hypothetical protein n=1 Tax=uncultured Thiodictyon sp. TaxID=1846217 RepID=UPI0025E04297